MSTPKNADIATISRSDLAASLESWGAVVSDSQLERWRTEGILSKAVRQPGLGRGLGRDDGQYPASSVQQVLAILELQKTIKSLADIGWHLWLRDFSVSDELIFPHFRNAAETIKSVKARAKNALDSDDDSEFSNITNLLFRVKSTSKTFGNIRKDIGAKRFPAFADILFQIAAGRELNIHSKDVAPYLNEALRPIAGKLSVKACAQNLNVIARQNRFRDFTKFLSAQWPDGIIRAKTQFLNSQFATHVVSDENGAIPIPDVHARTLARLRAEPPGRQAALILAFAAYLKAPEASKSNR
ncbi:hypothetical protein E8L99_20870 [Phreatobacter aquaticus]|uniref:Uncharacterized protein n=1 Tax=Phreatobacter aquaticus TaxID=2570229 RepID=A0A4D7QNF4_9HYPH|nr:hypothetical protein [Phreatobacter aquaticus]QCK88031.1 hypothetical protein E8L99_20870 [Phreatobacter aquaticus]